LRIVARDLRPVPPIQARSVGSFSARFDLACAV
jgi:hypothetical protein